MDLRGFVLVRKRCCAGIPNQPKAALAIFREPGEHPLAGVVRAGAADFSFVAAALSRLTNPTTASSVTFIS